MRTRSPITFFCLDWRVRFTNRLFIGNSTHKYSHEAYSTCRVVIPEIKPPVSTVQKYVIRQTHLVSRWLGSSRRHSHRGHCRWRLRWRSRDCLRPRRSWRAVGNARGPRPIGRNRPHLRSRDYSQAYKEHFELNSEITTRDRDGVQKTFSGLMKVLFPDGSCSPVEVEELLAFSMEGRKRVKDQILKIDETFAPVTFSYTDRRSGNAITVLTLEEKQHPSLARLSDEPGATEDASPMLPVAVGTTAAAQPLQPVHLVIPENSKGYSYRRLFAAYLENARDIVVLDPYVRAFGQIRNFMELVQLLHELTPEGEETKVRLVTKSDPSRPVEQDDNLRKIQDSCAGSRVSVEYEYDTSDSFHARSLTTDTGWKISLDRGLDIYQRYEISPFSLASGVQEERLTKAFEMTCLRTTG